MQKKNIIPTVVLAAICLCAALLLAFTNKLTKTKIERDLAEKAAAAMREVLPNAEGFEDITDKYEFSNQIQAAHKADIGYVFQITYKGYNSGNVMVCGVDNDGKLVKSKVITFADTYKHYLDKLTMDHDGADYDTAKAEVDLVTTPTSDTGKGYKSALLAAINAYNLVKGNETVAPEEPEEDPVEPVNGDGPVPFRLGNNNTIIVEEPVPLAAPVATGDNAVLWIAVIMMAMFAIVIINFPAKKRENETF